jgi:hypothetical protein
MPLQAPKRNPAGFFLSISPIIRAPVLPYTAGAWAITPEWCIWADDQRKALLGELLSNGSWFSKPPRREVLEPLFSPWLGTTMQGTKRFFCTIPEVPSQKSGSGSWNLEGLIMSASSITPVWSIAESADKEDEVEAINFFDGDTVDTENEEEKEINLEEIESASPAAPTIIRNREWETRKFLAKERVREARLKAQIAVRMAEAEETRYYRHYGKLDDNESHFSDYDLSEESDNESD